MSVPHSRILRYGWPSGNPIHTAITAEPVDKGTPLGKGKGTGKPKWVSASQASWKEQGPSGWTQTWYCGRQSSDLNPNFWTISFSASILFKANSKLTVTSTRSSPELIKPAYFFRNWWLKPSLLKNLISKLCPCHLYAPNSIPKGQRSSYRCTSLRSSALLPSVQKRARTIICWADSLPLNIKNSTVCA